MIYTHKIHFSDKFFQQFKIVRIVALFLGKNWSSEYCIFNIKQLDKTLNVKLKLCYWWIVLLYFL